jgi:hypothetical protein
MTRIQASTKGYSLRGYLHETHLKPPDGGWIDRHCASRRDGSPAERQPIRKPRPGTDCPNNGAGNAAVSDRQRRRV